MRTSCSQCGAGLRVLRREFFLRCPYCGARMLFEIPGRTLMISSPSIGEDSLRRLLPGVGIDAVELVYFPYREIPGASLEAAFSQPVPDLEGYRPPSASMTVLSENDASPDQLMPPAVEGVDDSVPDTSTIVYHPFFRVRTSDRGIPETLFVDAVSGLPVGGARAASNPVTLPSASFIEALIALSLLSGAVFAVARLAGAGLQGGLEASMIASMAGCAIHIRYRILR